jgi:Wiskott-Aldrich syndrome protein
MPPPALAEESRIVQALGSKPRFSAIVKLYLAQGSSWVFSGYTGALCLVPEVSRNCWVLRFVDLDSGSLKWEQEMYSSFIYKEPKSFFHTLETDDSVVGFSYADLAEAKEMLATVLYAKASSPVNANGPAPAGKSNKPLPVKEVKKVEEKKPKDKKKKGFFSKLFGSGEEETPNIEFSKPTGFRHQSHIGWDPSKGFEVDNIPADWKKLFQQAGIKKSELRDAETAKYVMGVLNEAIAAEEAGGPPSDNAPMAPMGSAPLPPGPPVMGGGGGPPPPPPPPPGPGAGGRLPTSIPTSGGGGGPPPPPPTPSGGGGGGGGGDEARGGLLSQIRGGAQLKKVDPAAVPDLKQFDQAKTTDLASVLASAMNSRRMDMNDEVPGTDGAGDDEWSD